MEELTEAFDRLTMKRPRVTNAMFHAIQFTFTLANVQVLAADHPSGLIPRVRRAYGMATRTGPYNTLLDIDM